MGHFSGYIHREREIKYQMVLESDICFLYLLKIGIASIVWCYICSAAGLIDYPCFPVVNMFVYKKLHET